MPERQCKAKERSKNITSEPKIRCEEHDKQVIFKHDIHIQRLYQCIRYKTFVKNDITIASLQLNSEFEL